MIKARKYILLLVGSLFVMGCQQGKKDVLNESDPQQKQLLQGIWIDEDAETAVFKVSGDTIYYPGSKTQSAYYRITKDSLWIYGGNELCYPIEQLTDHVLRFKNQYGEEVRLVKSNEQFAKDAFMRGGDDATIGSQVINQELLKHDSVITVNGEKYHAYVCVNPTKYKVIRNTYDTDGVGVGKIYYDNIVNLNLYKGSQKVFSSDFRKQDFSKFIPEDVMTQSVFNDIEYSKTDGKNLVFTAYVCMPESSASYQVEIIISPTGEKQLKVKD